ncbi:MAG: carbonic anhydrase [Cytophagales bacterium]|nr:carbonic anhydrase [Cytophagales bacterium]
MKRNLEQLGVLFLTLMMFSCANQNQTTEKEPVNENPYANIEPLVEKILTAEEQAQLTPDAVIQSLKEGNQRFINNDLTARDHAEQVRKSTHGQFPKAVVLSCLDSRIPVEDVFDKGIGDIFVARVAGNFINEDILGSMEFGCKVAGSKIIMIMGHESCGAVKAAIDNVEMGNITSMLTKIKPAVEKSQDFEGNKTSKNSEFVSHVAANNVKLNIEAIRERSPILKAMEDNKEIKIIGAKYDMDSGLVTFFD